MVERAIRFVRGLNIILSKFSDNDFATLSSSLYPFKPVTARSNVVGSSGLSLLIVTTLFSVSKCTNEFQTSSNCSLMCFRRSNHFASRIRIGLAILSSLILATAVQASVTVSQCSIRLRTTRIVCATGVGRMGSGDIPGRWIDDHTFECNQSFMDLSLGRQFFHIPQTISCHLYSLQSIPK
jgi:hypothetical protein